MEKRAFLFVYAVGIIGLFFFQDTLVLAHDNVVIVPLGGTVGDATTSDVVKGKTFSSGEAGKGAVGTLKIRDGSTIYTNHLGMDFSLIPAGTFLMGSPDSTETIPGYSHEPGRDVDETQHIVILSESFYMQNTEVTQGQWEDVMGANPSYFDTCGPDCPVETVSWDDVQGFIDTLNSIEGRFPCNIAPYCYTLPTESQWEYAARGGTVTAFYNGSITNTDDCSSLDPNLNEIGWYCGNSGSTTHPVAQKNPNNWGLYDMSGNVYEWCSDWYGIYPSGPVTDPTGPASGSVRVVRGGRWGYAAKRARSASRDNSLQDVRTYVIGFRLVLPPDQ